MLNIDIELINGKKNAIRNKADMIMSKIKKLERIANICNNDKLKAVTLDSEEVELIF